MKIKLCQLNFIVGDIEGNSSRIIHKINEGKKEGAEIVVFSELSLSGYPPKDLLKYPSFIDKCTHAIELIKQETEGICAIIGAPYYIVQDGKNYYNSAYVLHNKKCIKHYYKWLLPTYDVFDEARYFEAGETNPIFTLNGKQIAITICEDIWNEGVDKLYKQAPLDSIEADIDLIINLSASPFSYSHYEKRIEVIKAKVIRHNAPMVYVNQIGANAELIFDGGSLVMNSKGEITNKLAYFKEDSQVVDFPLKKSNISIPNIPKTQRIHDALIIGIRDYFNKLGFKKAVIGLSGGIDSAMVTYLAVKALGAENVLSVLLPSKFSSEHSVNDSIQLCENLNTPYQTISIEQTYEAVTKTLSPIFKNLPFDVTEENIQARSRGLILMALSNKFGYILLNTTNKSEAAVGYGTLYGDMCGGLAVLADVYKTELYEIANWVNTKNEIIPKNIITKAPSAELRPDQKDSDSLPDYDILDGILYSYIEETMGVEEIANNGYDLQTVERIVKMVNRNEYKRFQMAPVLRVSTNAFGFSRRMPLVGKY